MGNLHQLLAVKKEAKQRANEIAGETKKALGSKHLYFGSHKSYQPFDEEDSTRLPDEHEQMGYIVGEKMDWFGKNFGRLIDLELQIDRTNELARADLAVDGFNMNNVPAPFLLDFIGFLDKIRNVYAGIPVLDPKYQWEPDVTRTQGVFKTSEPEVSYRSKKVLRHKVLVEATNHHPAQVEKWPEEAQVGKYTKRMWSGSLTASQKATVLGRVDQLIAASKRALSEANNADHSNDKIAASLFSFLHDGIPTAGLLHDEDL